MKMRHFLSMVVVALAFTAYSDDYDDTELWNKVNDHEDRIEALETWQGQMNNNIAALQELINTTDYITTVTPVLENGEEVGYTIAFLHSDPITIYHGEKGDKGDQGEQGPQGPQGEPGEDGSDGSDGSDGDTPVIGVKADGGVYYWTVNGEWLLNDNQEKMPVTGEKGEDGDDAIAPQVRINKETNMWEISTDDGTTWTSTEVEATGDSFFQSVDASKEDYVTFTLADGTTFNVPKYQGAMLTFALDGTKLTDLTQVIDLAEGDLTYTATSGEVSVRILEGGGWSASAANGTITVSPGSLGEEALLEVTLTDNGKVMEIYRLAVKQTGLQGEGTEANPYQISSAGEFKVLGNAKANEYFELTSDIDLGGGEIMINTFVGILDGKGYTIRNFNIQDDGEYTHIGLFRQVDGTIKNLNTEGTVHKQSKKGTGIHAIGGVVAINNGTVENCTFKGSVISDVNDFWDYIGGVVGCVQNNGIVKGCAYLASADGKIDVERAQTTGGVVGWCNEDCYVIGCYNTGTIEYGNTAGTLGGVVGTVYGAHAVACYNTGVITVPEGTGGSAGVIGNNSMSTSTVTACYNAIDLQTSQDVFLIGYTGNGKDGTAKFNTCYWLEIEGYTAFSQNVTDDDCTDCSAKTSEELKSQATVDDLNSAISTWNTQHNKLCAYQFAVDSNGGYPILVEQD